MMRTMLKSKIHRATVTHADVNYEGSITIDADVMKAANILPNEHVHVWNVTNGARIETYALEGPAGSGLICINGAAAHLNKPGDLVIISTFAKYGDDELAGHEPKVVLVDQKNRISNAAHRELPGPLKAVSS